MELVVRKNELLRELQLFQGIVERKNTIPILANVLIEAKGDDEIEYDGETHSAANLFDALKEGYYGKL